MDQKFSLTPNLQLSILIVIAQAICHGVGHVTGTAKIVFFVKLFYALFSFEMQCIMYKEYGNKAVPYYFPGYNFKFYNGKSIKEIKLFLAKNFIIENMISMIHQYMFSCMQIFCLRCYGLLWIKNIYFITTVFFVYEIFCKFPNEV